MTCPPMGRGLVALRLSDALALRPHSASGTRKWERAGERRVRRVGAGRPGAADGLAGVRAGSRPGTGAARWLRSR